MRCLNVILNHVGLFQASKFHQKKKKNLAFVWLGDEDKSILIPSSIEGQGSHNHKLANAGQDFISLSSTYRKRRTPKLD